MSTLEAVFENHGACTDIKESVIEVLKKFEKPENLANECLSGEYLDHILKIAREFKCNSVEIRNFLKECKNALYIELE